MGAQAVRLSNVDIDNALKDKDFEVLFQPIFDLGNGALARVETFIRWRHPSLGVLPPGAFISFFETQGRMSELTRYVLAEALSEYKAWRGAYAPGFSINLALSDLSDETFPSHFTVLLRESGFPVELVTLECPMPAVDADVDAISRQLQRLAATGARLAIEVRGRANDFLKTIRPFPFAEIKTGGAAILRFARTVRGPGLSAISELLELAAEQNAAITAVGVEDQASLAALRGLGFAAAQGNHLAKVGELSQFMPSHVNDVRALLGLEPLSSDDLAALFRIGAPRLPAAPAEDVTEERFNGEPEEALFDEAAGRAAEGARSGEELVDRLSKRIARTGASTEDGGEIDDEARENAKAAAIARAKKKSRLREKLAARNALKEKAEARAETPAPRDMQERLSREFGEQADNTPLPDEFEIAAEAPHPETETQAEAALGPETPPPAAVKTFDVRIAVKGAKARFRHPIHVSGPEPLSPQEMGDLHKPNEYVEAARPEAAPAPAEEPEVEIPAPLSSPQWIEETVAIEAPAPKKPKPKNFLTRKYRIPVPKYSGHFWPRPIRKMMKRAGKAKAAE